MLGRIKSWLVGGTDELGWDDLIHRVVVAIGRTAHHGARGAIQFPTQTEVRITVPESSAEVIQAFVDEPEFDRRAGSELVNRFDCGVHDLPLRSYVVASGESVALEIVQSNREVEWRWGVKGGDLDGEQLSLPRGKGEIRFGRGPWHGTGEQLANDVVVSTALEFVSRRAGRLHRQGRVFEVEALDQGDCLAVVRASGERQRPSRTGRGRLPLQEGDIVELSDGGSQVIQLVLRSEAPE